MLGAVGGLEESLGLHEDAIGKLEVHGVRPHHRRHDVLDLDHLKENLDAPLLE